MTGSVVPQIEPPTEAEFRAAMLLGLSRCAHSPAGKRSLASAMDLTTKGVDNILLREAMPGAKRLWDAVSACPSALDDIADLYGLELVAVDPSPAEDLGTVPLATLLAKVAEAESPESDGGVAKTHNELIAMESDIRRVHALTAQWIHEITEYRSARTRRRSAVRAVK